MLENKTIINIIYVRKKAEESVETMKIARNNLRKFISSFEEGLSHTESD